MEYAYRFHGEPIVGHAFVTTYQLPGKQAGGWFLYGLFGYEASAGREAPARAAALRLLSSFNFEGRYAPQADLFFTLARDAALKALTGEKSADQASAISRRAVATPSNALEAAALGLVEVRDPSSPQPIPVQCGVAPALNGATGFSGAAFSALREKP